MVSDRIGGGGGGMPDLTSFMVTMGYTSIKHHTHYAFSGPTFCSSRLKLRCKYTPIESHLSCRQFKCMMPKEQKRDGCNCGLAH